MSSTEPSINFKDVLISLTAGAASGAFTKSIAAPLDRVRIIFQTDRDRKFSLRAVIGLIKTIVTEEGFFALWRGHSATLARVIPYTALQFCAFTEIKKLLKKDHHSENKNFSGYSRFTAGSAAGLIAATITYPLDFTRTRMSRANTTQKYRTLAQAIREIYKTEGLLVFYLGYVPTILGTVPRAGLTFYAYHTLKVQYTNFEMARSGTATRNSPMNFVFGGIGGVLGQSASYPFDIIRRRMQMVSLDAKCKEKRLGTFGTIRDIYKREGIRRGFYKGFILTWLRTPLAAGIALVTFDIIQDILEYFLNLA